jgi:hypothetical protein
LVVLGVFWLALQLFGPYTSLRNRVIFVVGTERLQQWAIETLDHPPPTDPFQKIVLEANDLPEDIRTLAGTYTGVELSDDGKNDYLWRLSTPNANKESTRHFVMSADARLSSF